MSFDIAALKRRTVARYPFFGSVAAGVEYEAFSDFEANPTYEDVARALAAYRTFFLGVLVLLAPLVALVWRVIPLPEEVRAKIRHHHAPH